KVFCYQMVSIILENTPYLDATTRVFELTTWLKRYQNGLFSPHLMYRIKSSTGKKKSWYEKSKLFFRHSLVMLDSQSLPHLLLLA
ncbi:MAG: hypothetical protein L6461_23675, partial [Anaerolineae bacterium]|nr:hypothetical protein [Anaerolineae bacterium]